MKKKILKPINNEDLLKIYRYFKLNKKIYTRIPISAKELSKLFDYRRRDIIDIIDLINKQKRFKYVILGSNEGFYFVDETNISFALSVLDSREDKCCSEYEKVDFLRDKIEDFMGL